MSHRRRAAFLILIAVAVMGISYITTYYIRQNSRSNVYEELKETTGAQGASEVQQPDNELTGENETQEKDPEEIVKPGAKNRNPTPAPAKDEYVSPVDFETLWELNPDIVAWIEIPETQIAYPILKHPEEDEYYLDHTVELAYGYPGSIFLRQEARTDFSLFNTVIYGHNMKNGTMFGTLKYYLDPSYLQEHRVINIYTPEAEYSYSVFAAVVYSDVLITAKYSNYDKQDRQAFLDSLGEARNLSNIVLDDVEVTPEDHIITLSTCYANRDELRLLIVAVRDDG